MRAPGTDPPAPSPPERGRGDHSPIALYTAALLNALRDGQPHSREELYEAGRRFVPIQIAARFALVSLVAKARAEARRQIKQGVAAGRAIAQMSEAGRARWTRERVEEAEQQARERFASNPSPYLPEGTWRVLYVALRTSLRCEQTGRMSDPWYRLPDEERARFAGRRVRMSLDNTYTKGAAPRVGADLSFSAAAARDSWRPAGVGGGAQLPADRRLPPVPLPPPAVLATLRRGRAALTSPARAAVLRVLVDGGAHPVAELAAATAAAGAVPVARQEFASLLVHLGARCEPGGGRREPRYRLRPDRVADAEALLAALEWRERALPGIAAWHRAGVLADGLAETLGVSEKVARTLLRHALREEREGGGEGGGEGRRRTRVRTEPRRSGFALAVIGRLADAHETLTAPQVTAALRAEQQARLAADPAFYAPDPGRLAGGALLQAWRHGLVEPAAYGRRVRRKGVPQPTVTTWRSLRFRQPPSEEPLA